MIERKAIDDPDKELSKWVVESFGQSEIKVSKPDPKRFATFESVASRYDLANHFCLVVLIIIGGKISRDGS